MAEKTSSGLGVLAGVLVVGGVIFAASQLPPDPFENEEPREVRLKVTWDTQGGQFTRGIAWDIGEQQDELVATESPWSHVTTAQEGTVARVSAIPSGTLDVRCQIYVNEELMGTDETEDPTGCFVEVVVP